MESAQQLAALKSVAPDATYCAMKYGVPASVTLAQWILESSWGQSRLTVEANNCFGIKCSNLESPATYVEFTTKEFENGHAVFVKADFAKYSDVAESFDAHACLLSQSTRYHRAMLSASQPSAFAAALQQAGYSTNPNYAAELLQLMRLYNLTQYDAPPPAAQAQKAA